MAQNFQDDRSTSSHSTGFVRPYYNSSHRYKPNGHSSAHQYNQPNIMHHSNYRKQSNYHQDNEERRGRVKEQQDLEKTKNPDRLLNKETRSKALIEQIEDNTCECLICWTIIKSEVAVWNCSRCYQMFHMQCIKKWAESSLSEAQQQQQRQQQQQQQQQQRPQQQQQRPQQQQQSQQQPQQQQEPTNQQQEKLYWRCPYCQHTNDAVPNKYTCFCGQKANPEYKHIQTPHSCGKICNRKSSDPRCTHRCPIFCHPGPCNSCEIKVTRSCGCGKLQSQVKCNSKTPECENICNKPLNCKIHACALKCHDGECKPCDTDKQQHCHSHRTQRTLKCGSVNSNSGSFECSLICDRLLNCGEHACQKTCHPGSCDACSQTLKCVAFNLSQMCL